MMRVTTRTPSPTSRPIWRRTTSTSAWTCGATNRRSATCLRDGKLRLRSPAGRYDLGSSSGLTAAQLALPHLCKIEATYHYGGVDHVSVLWEGIAGPPTVSGAVHTPNATFELSGGQAVARRARHDQNIATGRTIAEELAALDTLLTPTGQTGTALVPALTMGNVVFEGNLQRYLELFGRFIGGWIMEGARGEQIALNASSVETEAAASTLTPTMHRINPAGFSVTKPAGLVRNTTELVSITPSGVSQVTEDYSGTNSGSDFDYEVVTYTPPDGATITGFLVLNLSGGVTDDIRVVNNVVWWTVGIPGNTAWTAQLLVGLRTDEIVTGRTLPLAGIPAALQTSVDSYGERELEFPQWFNGTETGFAVAEAWLTRLAEPLDIVGLPFYRIQATAERSEEVDAVKPGSVHELRVTDPNTARAIDHKALCLGVSLRYRYNKTPERICSFVRIGSSTPLPVLVWDRDVWNGAVWAA